MIDELTAILAELDDDTNQFWVGKRKRWANFLRGQTAELSAVRAEVEALRAELRASTDTLAESIRMMRANADRYRWLRDAASGEWVGWADERADTTPAEIDAAIDAARAALKESDQ